MFSFYTPCKIPEKDKKGKLARNKWRTCRVVSSQPEFTCSKLTIETLEQGVELACCL